MTLVFAAIAPHGGPVFDNPESPTRKSMEELGRRFDAAEPEAAIVLTPHGVHVDDHFAVVRSANTSGVILCRPARHAAVWTTLAGSLRRPRRGTGDR